MKRSTKIILSLVLAGGVVSAVVANGQRPFCQHGPGGGGEHKAGYFVSYVSEQLALSDTQRGTLEALVTEGLALRTTMKEGRAQGKAEMLALLDAPTLDQQRLLTLVQKKAERVNAEAPALVASLAAFTDSLEPSQRAELRSRMDKRFGSHWYRGGR